MHHHHNRKQNPNKNRGSSNIVNKNVKQGKALLNVYYIILNILCKCPNQLWQLAKCGLGEISKTLKKNLTDHKLLNGSTQQ